MSRFTHWPAREVIFVARHETIGDDVFCRKIDKAFLQMIGCERGCDQDTFTASNGVTITAIPVPQATPAESHADDDPGALSDLPDERLQLAYQAVSDQQDSLDAIYSAVQDGDISEALRLIKIARESLTEHVDTLRGLL